MAKGKSCPNCKHSMYAEKEDNQPAGRYVTYICKNHNPPFREKVFESYADR